MKKIIFILALLLSFGGYLEKETWMFPATALAQQNEERTLEASYPNFEVYRIRRNDIQDGNGVPVSETEITNRRSEKILLRVRSSEYMPDDLWYNLFYPVDDDTLLWCRCSTNTASAEYQYLKSDGSLEPLSVDFQVRMQDRQGRFLVRKAKNPAETKRNLPAGQREWVYGVVDTDLKTVLLPCEFTGGAMLADGKGEPHFYNGYLVLERNGKYGVWDYNLCEVIPCIYDAIWEEMYHIFRYQHGTEQGVLFAESGLKIPNCTLLHGEPHTVSVLSPDGQQYLLYDRYGNLLFRSSREINNSPEPHITVEGMPISIPEVEKSSNWVKGEIAAARSAGLIPEETDWLYTATITRRDFCKLAMQLIRKVKPSEYHRSDKEVSNIFCDIQSGISYDESIIGDAVQTGIISGFPDSTFRPFAPITRQDAAIVLSKTAERLEILKSIENIPVFKDIEVASPYAREAIRTMSGLETIDGIHVMGGDENGNFLPQILYTTEQAIAAIYRLYCVYMNHPVI